MDQVFQRMEDAAKSQRAIIFFLWKEGEKTANIVRRLKAVFGEAALSKSTVYDWVDRLKNGRQSLEDDPRSGRPATAVNPQMIQLVEDLVMQDRRITVQEICDHFGLHPPSVIEILHDHLHLNKVSARWVPRLLTPLHKQHRMEMCQELLDLCDAYGDDFWQRIITVDETWLPYFNPETKVQSMQWRRADEGPPIKAKAVPSAGKTMVTVFWDCDGIILIDYLPQGATINAQYYSDLLKGPVVKALQEKRPGKLEARPLLQHDNARPHTARATMATIAELGWEMLPHPPYSPDLAPSDYHLFGPFKLPLRGTHYPDLNSMKRDIRKWEKDTPIDFFAGGLRKLVDRWRLCIRLKGDYIEKCHIDENE